VACHVREMNLCLRIEVGPIALLMADNEGREGRKRASPHYGLSCHHPTVDSKIARGKLLHRSDILHTISVREHTDKPYFRLRKHLDNAQVQEFANSLMAATVE